MRIDLFGSESKIYHEMLPTIRNSVKVIAYDTFNIGGFKYDFRIYNENFAAVSRNNEGYLVGFVKDGESNDTKKKLAAFVRKVFTSYPLESEGYKSTNIRLSHYGLKLEHNFEIVKIENTDNSEIKARLERFKEYLKIANQKVEAATDYCQELKEKYEALLETWNNNL